MDILRAPINEWMQQAFAAAFPDTEIDGSLLVVVPTDNPEFGHYQCNAAMSLAKILQANPRQIAQAVIDQGLKEVPWLEKVDIAGPGFINFMLKDAYLTRYCSGWLREQELPVPPVGKGKRLVIDYSSPNIAKPMHIGHIRSTVIGNALYRIFKKLNYAIVSDNHLGDWGTQFGLLIKGYREWLDAEALEKNPVEELERLYVKSYERSKDDEVWLEQVREELVKLQQGDAENFRLWETFVSLSLQEFEKIYARLDVHFDLTRGESYYRNDLAAVVEQLSSQNILEESEGAKIVNLEAEGLGVSIVQKSDGGYNYTTTDLATIKSRIEEFKPERIIYVTDERQQLHFKQFFHLSKAMGHEVGLKHIWFGLMRLPEGTFSTRQGNVIKLEKLLDEAVARALEVVKKSSPHMEEAKQLEVAEAVGIGAIKYMDLSQNPQSLVTFSWEKALSLEGNSAPYLQYAYARIRSVLDRFKEEHPEVDLNEVPIEISEPIESSILFKLCQYPEAVVRSAENYKPNIIADYLFELAQLYSSYYQNVPFLKAEEMVRGSRMNICELVSRTMRDGLNLLGIECPERI